MSDVPLGVFLSGGLDSSCIAAQLIHLRRATQPLEQRYRGVSVAFTDDEKARLTGLPAARVSERLVKRLAQEWAENEGLPPLERMLELDRRIWLPDDLLMKADKMTMATSQELRVPFLDHRLIESAAGLPVRAKLRSNVGKWLLLEAARERLQEVSTAPGQRGMTVPV